MLQFVFSYSIILLVRFIVEEFLDAIITTSPIVFCCILLVDLVL